MVKQLKSAFGQWSLGASNKAAWDWSLLSLQWGTMERCCFFLLFLGLSSIEKFVVLMNTLQLLLSRVIWEPLIQAKTSGGRTQLELYFWLYIWGICGESKQKLALHPEREGSEGCGTKRLADTFRMRGTPQCWENPESWCGEGPSEIQRGSLCSVCDERWWSGWNSFPTWWEWDAPGRRTHLSGNHSIEREVQENECLQ